MVFSRLLAMVAAAAVAVCGGIWLWLRFRKKKSASEIERERRLAVNASGRMTDGTLTEAFNPKLDPESMFLLFYRYSVAGVEYSAAQDLSDLRSVMRPRTYSPGEPVTIKYHPHNPLNSIVVCEQWNGLRKGTEHGAGNQILPFPGKG